MGLRDRFCGFGAVAFADEAGSAWLIVDTAAEVAILSHGIKSEQFLGQPCTSKNSQKAKKFVGFEPSDTVVV